ncbi:peptidase M50 [Candidatus Woesearchaeota archaeon]|nr:peptidase M50 [Candidatus Woesearchaeota archaeon]
MHYNKAIRLGNLATSEIEIRDILKAWAAISIAFAIALSSGLSDFYAKFIIASLTVGIGFLLHELGHKAVAQRYGCFAEFRSFDSMLLLAIAMSFFGFIFAAPGAVMISGRVSGARNGRISAAGPAVNLALALIFLLLAIMQLPGLLMEIAYYGFVINSWLALFNMIPFWLFDGYKVLKWSKAAYGIIVAAAFGLMLLRNFLPLPR